MAKFECEWLPRKELRNILFWAAYGIGKAKDGQRIDETIAALHRLGKDHNVYEARKAEAGKYLPKRKKP